MAISGCNLRQGAEAMARTALLAGLRKHTCTACIQPCLVTATDLSASTFINAYLDHYLTAASRDMRMVRCIVLRNQSASEPTAPILYGARLL